MSRQTEASLGGNTMLVGLIVASACLGPLAGCSPRVPEPPMPDARLVWPAPPAKARVSFVKVISGPEDLGIKPSLWQRLRYVISGAHRRGMVRPAAVAVSGEMVAVADPGAAGVHLFDPLNASYRFVSGCNGEEWMQPIGVAFLAGRLYVSDSAERAIFVLGQSGECLDRWEGFGSGRPTGLAADSVNGRLLVADTRAHKVIILSPDGVPMVDFGKRGNKPGEFNFPGWLSIGRQGEIYVVDSLNFRIQVLDIRGGTVEIFGKVGDSAGYFARPKGIGVDSKGHIYVVDALFDAIQIFDKGGRLLLNFGERGTGPGQFWLPSGLFIDDHDFVYVADSYNKRVQVFRFLGGE